MAYMITTSDNPWNPVTHFKEWYAYDVAHGYNTCSYLARIAKTSMELTDEENERIIDQAIDDIISLNVTGNYVRIAVEEPTKYVLADPY
jgi:hypothetical protein